MPVYSTKFVEAAAFSGAASYRYTVPPGQVAVVKCMSVVWGDITASGLDAWFQSDSLAKLARFTWAFGFSTPYNLGGQQQWWGSWVLTAGQLLGIQTAAGTCDMWASGYLLDAP
jgi:hypothetical protein